MTTPHSRPTRILRPVFVVGPPESGIDVVAGTVAQALSLVEADSATPDRFDGIDIFHPRERGWDSNRLRATDARAEHLEAVDQHLVGRLPASESPTDRPVVALAAGSLQVSFLAAAYPGAHFVVVHRDVRECLASMLDAWSSQQSVSYPELPGWQGPSWSLLLTPEWRSSVGRSMAEVVAQQWRSATDALVADLAKLKPGQRTVLDVHQVLSGPQGALEWLRERLELEAVDGAAAIATDGTSLDSGAWQRHEDELAAVLDLTEEAATQLAQALVASQANDSEGTPGGEPPSPFRSTSRSNFAPILRELGSSLMVSTYQSGQLVAVRQQDGKLNTHFRSQDAPMGLAFHQGRLVVGTRAAVREFRNVPAVIPRLEAPEQHDACFLPSRVDYTGDIRVHDVGWVDDEPWVVATRFSCLATLDSAHSFIPRWKPPFITKIQAEDRCHLNGMAIHEGRVRWVTALGVSDEPGGWRERKADGGVIMDVTNNDTVVEGLSMPHSPRWYRDRLWVLESGRGTLARVDLETGTVETVAELPGFTRGLAFAGPLAFVGLSEVREANTFGGIPLTARLEERECGVWVVNIESGQIISFLRFEDRVEEIFDVCLLPGIAFPELLDTDSPIPASTFMLPPAALEPVGVR